MVTTRSARRYFSATHTRGSGLSTRRDSIDRHAGDARPDRPTDRAAGQVQTDRRRSVRSTGDAHGHARVRIASERQFDDAQTEAHRLTDRCARCADSARVLAGLRGQRAAGTPPAARRRYRGCRPASTCTTFTTRVCQPVPAVPGARRGNTETGVWSRRQSNLPPQVGMPSARRAGARAQSTRASGVSGGRDRAEQRRRRHAERDAHVREAGVDADQQPCLRDDRHTRREPRAAAESMRGGVASRIAVGRLRSPGPPSITDRASRTAGELRRECGPALGEPMLCGRVVNGASIANGGSAPFHVRRLRAGPVPQRRGRRAPTARSSRNRSWRAEFEREPPVFGADAVSPLCRGIGASPATAHLARADGDALRARQSHSPDRALQQPLQVEREIEAPRAQLAHEGPHASRQFAVAVFACELSPLPRGQTITSSGVGCRRAARAPAVGSARCVSASARSAGIRPEAITTSPIADRRTIRMPSIATAVRGARRCS